MTSPSHFPTIVSSAERRRANSRDSDQHFLTESDRLYPASAMGENDSLLDVVGSSCCCEEDEEGQGGKDDTHNHLRPPANHHHTPPRKKDNLPVSDNGSERGGAGDCGGVPLLTPLPGSPYSDMSIKCMRHKLRFFFMNPIEKWRIRRQIPWKLVMQVFKVIIVTMQVSLFGNDRYSHVAYYWGTKITMSHLFLRDWDSAREIVAYPPSEGPYSVFTKAEFHESIDYAVKRYAHITDESVGSYAYTMPDGSREPAQLCKTFYRKVGMWPYNMSFVFDSEPVEKCLDIPKDPSQLKNMTFWDTFSSQEYLAANNFSLHFERLISARLTFPLSVIHLQGLSTFETPNCFQIDVVISFDNGDHDGQIKIDCEIDPSLLLCKGQSQYEDRHYAYRMFTVVLNGVVIIVTLLSFTLCLRALVRGQLLQMETSQFFAHHFGRRLALLDRMEFLNLWYMAIVANDLLIFLGTLIKIQIENKLIENDLYNVCGVLLGAGNLLVWVGVLRYLCFFPKYNILILTVKRALPDVARFMLCTMIVYVGFVFCGWVVLGPYHMKFRSFSTTSECLFALVNGDDMFATFNVLAGHSQLVWYFSRVYIYGFISLFIYVVLSLCIALIMDAYETVQIYYRHGFPKSEIMQFVEQCPDPIPSNFRSESSFTRFLKTCWFKTHGHHHLNNDNDDVQPINA